MDNAKLYMRGTTGNRGALSLYHVYGDEGEMGIWFDGRVGPKGCGFPRNAMNNNELRYGWLSSPREGVVDEVMLGKPVTGMRVLMTHGGGEVGRVVERYMTEAGYSLIEEGSDVSFANSVDVVCDAVLSGCLTGEQAAAVLLWRRDGGAFPRELLRTRRVVLAGAPNAGKSSLLNCLSGYERAFVHAEAGATRDIVDELVDVGGYGVWLGDLPGFMNGDIGLGAEAWLRAEECMRFAETVWLVVDGSQPWEGATEEAVRRVGAVAGGKADVLLVINKADLPAGFSGEPWREVFPGAEGVRVCSLPDGDAGERLGEAVGRGWGIS